MLVFHGDMRQKYNMRLNFENFGLPLTYLLLKKCRAHILLSLSTVLALGINSFPRYVSSTTAHSTLAYTTSCT